MGTVEHVVADRTSTVFTGSKGDISGRIDEVNALLENEHDTFRVTQLKKRLGRLNGSIANIMVGGASETEQTEIKYRIEDALNSTKSAVEDGIVEGGGTAMLKASALMEMPKGVHEEYDAGFKIVVKAMETPARQIMTNAGLPADAIIAKIKDSGVGYNALINEYQDLYENGIIDPFRCVKNELENAIATAGILLTSDVAITLKPDDGVSNNS